METNRIKSYNEIMTDGISPVGYLKNDEKEEILNSLKQIRKYLDVMVDCLNKDDIPILIKAFVENRMNEFVGLVGEIENPMSNLSRNEIANRKGNTLEATRSMYRNTFQVQTKEAKEFMAIYSLVGEHARSRIDIEMVLKDSMKKNLINYDNELKKIDKLISSKEKEYAAKDATINGILEEIRKKTGEVGMDEYSKIFKRQADKYSATGNGWIITGIIVAIIFILTFSLGFYNEFSTEESVFHDGKYVGTKYLVTNIILKGLVISVFVFLISFSFRQYLINRHLSTMNTHRQNAIDSYKLIVETIDKEDNARKVLMVQLAKTIYEMGPTGLIKLKESTKLDGGFNGIIKLLEENKPK